MAKQLRFHPFVADDLASAIEWYEDRSIGLGVDFRCAVDARFDTITLQPESFPRAFDDLDIRFGRLARFPYLILFRIQREFVYVLGVFHSASDPGKWRQRMT